MGWRRGWGRVALGRCWVGGGGDDEEWDREGEVEGCECEGDREGDGMGSMRTGRGKVSWRELLIIITV